MGTATFARSTNDSIISLGNAKMYLGSVTLSNSYATGGDTLNLATALGVDKILRAILTVQSGSSQYILRYDNTNGKVKAYYYDYDAAADGAAIEVAATTDLSSVTADATVIAR